jgi:hypothetical protein
MPKLLITATAGTQQPSHQEHRGKAMKERGSEEGKKVGKLRRKQSAYSIANRTAHKLALVACLIQN